MLFLEVPDSSLQLLLCTGSVLKIVFDQGLKYGGLQLLIDTIYDCPYSTFRKLSLERTISGRKEECDHKS